MARVYATPDDYATFTGVDPGTATTALLRRCSADIDRYTLTAHYLRDDTGYPTDPAIIEALKDATCAQAAWYLETSDGDATGAAGQYDSVSIGSVSMSKRSGSDTTATPASSRESPEAIQILANAGLLQAAL